MMIKHKNNASDKSCGHYASVRIASLSLLMLALVASPAIVAAKLDSNQKSSKVDSVLVDTKKAIASLRIDPELSLASVNQAIESIKTLEKSYQERVRTETKSKSNTKIAKDYQHFYPNVSSELLGNIGALPTLSYKLNTNHLYSGSHDKDQLDRAYFDYTFAKASLMTAKNAINDNDSLEAMANLKRVFEAVYLAPEFNISE